MGLNKLTDVETRGNRTLRRWAFRRPLGHTPVKGREVGVDQGLYPVVPVGAARNDDLEHVGLFQAQEDTSRFLPLLVC